MTAAVSTENVIAFRLAAHGLTERLPQNSLVRAVGRCGIQNSPPGSALLALHARVNGLAQAQLDDAVAHQKTLVQTWSMRGAPFFVPTADLAVFTTGVLPTEEQGRLQLIQGVGPDIDRLGMTLAKAVELTAAAVREVLAADHGLAITELGAQAAALIEPELTAPQRMIWRSEGPHAAGQPLGEAVVHFCVRILCLQQLVCFAPRHDNTAPFVLVDGWLDMPPPQMSPSQARAELLRRYLHCFGPATKAGFASWIGLRTGDIDPWWSSIADELVPVPYGRGAWLLDEDLAALHSATMPQGARLLPPRDPFTQLRDRETLVAKRYHREIWRTVGEPGTVLVDGRIVGIWRPRKSGKTLNLTITGFNPLGDDHRMLLEAEAAQIAPLRGAERAAVVFDSY